ncbi:ras and EF-hand domain-containing protein-like [Planoprotostelium fungivorum]|uniref:Ras and EF-hand domain-containing protein-like n=1 Tax=Planoprotostelium fungivorum TaxID=1890364 RepID=A0A2P6MN97_9EUKA|nr:ras and EF-hand domain-containing protein-like [Planoprotostelium fungivorum]
MTDTTITRLPVRAGHSRLTKQEPREKLPVIHSPKSSPDKNNSTEKNRGTEKNKATEKKTRVQRQRETFNPMTSTTWRTQKEQMVRVAKQKPKFTGIPKVRLPSHLIMYDGSSLNILREYFIQMDEDGDGTVSRKEFRNAYQERKTRDLKVKGASAPAMPLLTDSFFDIVDENQSETISFKELVKAMYPRATKEDLQHIHNWAFPPKTQKEKTYAITNEGREELASIFKLYDTDDSGEITLDEFRQATANLGFSYDDSRNMFESIDLNKDNMVSLEEFIEGLGSTYLRPASTQRTSRKEGKSEQGSIYVG